MSCAGAPGSILSVRNLCVHVAPTRQTPGLPILDELSFDLPAGRTLGIFGDSGCGKSTLARTLLGILPRELEVRRGSILLGSTQLIGASDNTLRQLRGSTISLVHQEAEGALHPLMRVRDQIAEIFRAHRSWNRQKRLTQSQSILQEVFAQDANRMGRSYPHELSGGQRQRVLIAQAIACRPQLLVADEPTASLDVSTQAEIILLIAELKKRHGTSLILITHNPVVLSQLADDIMVMYSGRVVEYGPAPKVFSNPLHPYTQGLMELARRKLVTRTDNRPGPPIIADSTANSSSDRVRCGCAYEPRCDRRLPQCSAIEPVLTSVAKNHQVRCVLYEG
jgi:peptide/nickel transport system ATP-binding protein